MLLIRMMDLLLTAAQKILFLFFMEPKSTVLYHRIAMTFAIAGLNADGETMITDSDCVDVSYPGFLHN